MSNQTVVSETGRLCLRTDKRSNGPHVNSHLINHHRMRGVSMTTQHQARLAQSAVKTSPTAIIAGPLHTTFFAGSLGLLV